MSDHELEHAKDGTHSNPALMQEDIPELVQLIVREVAKNMGTGLLKDAYDPREGPARSEDNEGHSLGTLPPAEKVKQPGLPVFQEGMEKSKPSEPEHPTRHTPSGVVGAETKSTQSDLKEGSGNSPGVFILSEGLPPVPAKLVTKIQRGDYVDMAELLRDNMEMERRQPSDAQGIGRQGRREVPDILSWITCFGMYASVLCDKYPDKVRQMFAYQTIMVREARRCGGKGWLAYDMMFWQQAANIPKVDWSVINNSLYSTTFLAQQNNRGRTCQWCMETDHTSANCAMAPTVTAPSRQGRSSQRDVFSDERRLSFKRPEARGACFAWNEGHCTLPYCRYKHICAKCGSSDHKDSHCTRSLPNRSVEQDGTGSSREGATISAAGSLA